MRNYFELFSLPACFGIDSQALDMAYSKIQKLVHPDRFATASEAEKKRATQWAAMTNDAYQTLRDPIKRGFYLCSINGCRVREENHADLPADFLMQQMDWHESLQNAAESGNRPAVEKLADMCAHQKKQLLQSVKTFLDQQQFEDAAKELQKMMFLEKFSAKIEPVLEKFDSKY